MRVLNKCSWPLMPGVGTTSTELAPFVSFSGGFVHLFQNSPSSTFLIICFNYWLFISSVRSDDFQSAYSQVSGRHNSTLLLHYWLLLGWCKPVQVNFHQVNPSAVLDLTRIDNFHYNHYNGGTRLHSVLDHFVYCWGSHQVCHILSSLFGHHLWILRAHQLISSKCINLYIRSDFPFGSPMLARAL